MYLEVDGLNHNASALVNEGIHLQEKGCGQQGNNLCSFNLNVILVKLTQSQVKGWNITKTCFIDLLSKRDKYVDVYELQVRGKVNGYINKKIRNKYTDRRGKDMYNYTFISTQIPVLEKYIHDNINTYHQC